MSDRILSASFPAGPPSPSSPPAIFLKEDRLDHTPHTPKSPTLMSISPQKYAPNLASSQMSLGQTTSQSINLSSPSSTPMSTQVSQQPSLMSMTASFPTPASSVSGHAVNTTSIDDSDNVESSFGAEPAPNGPPDVTAPRQQGEHRRTDHDRHLEAHNPESGTYDSSNSFGGLGKGEKNVDAMDIEKDHTVGSSLNNDLGLDSLQKNFTSAFHLCKSSHPPTGPDPALDLISLYGLGSIAKSVARMDPVTGEKINRLRKSYEGKLKGLGLAGRNKPVKHEVGAPGGLRHLTMWPDEEWQNQKVSGKEIKIADIDSALYSLQMRAMKMEPGTVPNHEYWADVLGHEKPSKHAGGSDFGKKAFSPSNATGPGQSNGTPIAAEPERTRPSRGKKRTYDDNSFVGYGEGYADDDDDNSFYSNGEGFGKKKRKKV